MARSVGQEQYLGTVINTAPVTDAGAPLQGSYDRRASHTDRIERLFSYYRLPERGLSNDRQSLSNILWATDVGTWEWHVRPLIRMSCTYHHPTRR